MKARLSDICKIINGRAFKQNELLQGGKYRVLRVGNFFTSDRWYYSDLELDEDKYCDNGDLLFAWSATFGPRIWNGEKVIYHYHIWKMIPNEKVVDKYFLYYWLKQNVNSITSGVHGSVMAHITKNDMERYEIDLPSLDIQKKAALLLRAFDDKIRINAKINQNLLQQAQIVFVYMFKNNETVKPATIADVSLNVTDGVHNTVVDDPNGQYLLLSCKNIKGGSLNIGASERRINKETFEKLRRRTKLAKGDVLISSVGTVGELLMLNSDPTNYEFQRSVAIVKPNTGLISSYYLFESLTAQKAELINAAHGAVQQCLFISDIAGFPIGIPSLDDLQVFDNTVKPMFDAITENEAENKRLEELRDTLLPKLMSGELDVSTIEI